MPIKLAEIYDTHLTRFQKPAAVKTKDGKGSASTTKRKERRKKAKEAKAAAPAKTGGKGQKKGGKPLKK